MNELSADPELSVFLALRAVVETRYSAKHRR